jgi:hypothetical protein
MASFFPISFCMILNLAQKEFIAEGKNVVNFARLTSPGRFVINPGIWRDG